MRTGHETMTRELKRPITLAGALAALLLAAPLPALAQPGASWARDLPQDYGIGAPLLHKAGILDIFRGGPPPQQPAPPPPQFETVAPPAAPAPDGAPGSREPRGAVPSGGTFRTLCVRTCDGYYFPISFKVGASKFRDDAALCLARCGGAEARLFVYRNPGQEPAAAVDLQGNRYADLENAFRYRKELVEGCSCNADAWRSVTGDRN